MSVYFRRGTLDDSYAVYQVFQAALLDLSARQGTMAITGGSDPVKRENLWNTRKSLFEHLARTAHEFWVAEKNECIVGYARSILRDTVLELTEFFIAPDAQAQGIGGELLRRAFTDISAAHRIIVATTDVRAQVRYLKAGVVPYFPEMYWSRKPERVTISSDLEFARAMNMPETRAQLAAIDRVILGHTRTVDHEWLLETRHGYLYKRAGAAVGYGYHDTGMGSGPFALYDARDFSAVLAHAENAAHHDGLDEIGFDIPMINRAAIDFFLAREYQLDSFVGLMMCDVLRGKFENYVLTGPPFFI